jgi:competence protein ComEC
MAFIAGVLLQTYLGLSSVLSGYLFIIGFSFYSIIACLPIQFRFRYRYLQSSVLLMMVTLAAAILTLQQDIRKKQNWFGHHLKNKDAIEVILQEPLSEKQKSYKVMADAVAVLSDKKRLPVTGKILLYLPKDSLIAKLRYGDRLFLSADPVEIPAAGNPGAFDYRRYLGFQQVYLQVFVKPGQWLKTGEPQVQEWRRSIFQLREQVLEVLRRNVSGGPQITGIAEALLIGYKDDLDHSLVQDYSKTGVIHIIAISGLHLGLIYAVMNYLLGLIPFLNRRKWMHAILIIAGLWIFSLLSGASASVLRSAVMLTCIISGKAIQPFVPFHPKFMKYCTFLSPPDASA